MENMEKIYTTKIHLRVHAHSTEVDRKVTETLLKILPEKYTYKDLDLMSTTMSAGNGLKIYTISLTEQEDIQHVHTYFKNRLTLEDKQRLAQSFDNRLERNKRFYFRINKQQLYLGEVKLKKGTNIVHVIISLGNLMFDEKLDEPTIRDYLLKLGYLAE